MMFSVYDAASSGNQKWSEIQTSVSIEKGIFHVLLGSVNPIPDSVFNSPNRWLELSVAGQTLAPRTRIVSVPSAYNATYSDTAVYARNSAPDNDWIRGTPDSVLYTIRELGLVKTGNTTRGLDPNTYVDFGVQCTTGTTGLQTTGITIGGGTRHYAPREFTTICGGFYNNALARYTTIAGGYSNDVDSSSN